MPYGWQFPAERVFVPASKGAGVHCFALLRRTSALVFATTQQSITSAFLLEQLERLSLAIQKTMMIVLDNARVHT